MTEPQTALGWVIECAMKVKGWDQRFIQGFELGHIDYRDDNNWCYYCGDMFNNFGPLTNDADAWAVMEKLMKMQGFTMWHTFDMPRVSTSAYPPVCYETIPACLRADGIDPLKALLVYAPVKWL